MIWLNDVELQLRSYPDGTLFMKVPKELIRARNIIRWKYEDDAELFALCCVKRKLDEFGRNITAVLQMRYIPHARQDRVKRPDDVFSLKYFAEIINSLGFENVYVLDPHSSVSEALIDRVVVDNAQHYIEQVIRKIGTENLLIYYPDNGSYKKYSDFLKMPACFGVKQRDWDTGKITGLQIENNGISIEGKTILMVDDIISYGGSMYYGAQALKDAGCGDIYIYASHVENSVLRGNLIDSGLFKRIYTTDSLFSGEHPLITLL